MTQKFIFTRLDLNLFSLIPKDRLLNILMFTFFQILSFNNIVIDHDVDDNTLYKNNLLNISLDLGSKVISVYVRELYKLKKVESPNLKLKEFKDTLLENDLFKPLDNPEFTAKVGVSLIEILKAASLIEDKIFLLDRKKHQNILCVTNHVLKIFEPKGLLNKPIIPMNLPMIVEPKEYKDHNYLNDGGFLLNDEHVIQSLFTKSMYQGGQTVLLENNKVIPCINDMMKIPFKINIELLDYISEHPHIIYSEIGINPPYDNNKILNSRERKANQK